MDLDRIAKRECPHRRLPGSEPCPYCELGLSPPPGYVDPTTPSEFTLRRYLRIQLMDFESVWPGMKRRWKGRKGACLAWWIARVMDAKFTLREPVKP